MSLEKLKTGEKPSRCFTGEGRREKTGQPPASSRRSGGVGVDGTSVSSARESWENSGDGSKTRPTAQAGPTSEAGGVTGEVGVPHINIDLLYKQRSREPRGDTCSMRGGEGKDAGMAGATQIITPDKVRTLQIALYRKAKAEPKYRFWSLYGERLRLDVLERAFETQRQNGGAAGVDGQSLAVIAADPERRQQWLAGLREELRRKTYRPSPVRRAGARLKRWLAAKGLTLNEVKTRTVNIRQTGINFLGFNLTWRRSPRGRGYLHAQPSQKSRGNLRVQLEEVLNHWTLWRPIKEVVREVNQVLRGWVGYFHFGNSVSVMNRMKHYSQDRLRRWLWRKHGCRHSLWQHYPLARLHAHYGLYELPTKAKWKAAR